MKIAIIGAGNIGTAYAQALSAASFDIVIGHRDSSKAKTLAQQIGPRVQGSTVADAFHQADIVLLALPYEAILDTLSGDINVTDKILVDVSNPLSADFQDLVVGCTTSAAEQIQAAAPTAHVVKAFNTIFAQLVLPASHPAQPLQVFIAGDDEAATTKVSDMAKALGFLPVNAGPLRNSRFLEPMGMMNIQFGFFLDVGPVTAPAWIHVQP